MSLKLKILGLGILAVMATSAFAVMNASATVGGHVIHEGPDNHVTITGTENTGTPHVLHFKEEGAAAESAISCHKTSYHGVMNAKTVTSVTITPSWSSCTTTDGSNTAFEIHENGCTFTFRSGKTGQTHHTAELLCPAGKAVEITHPNCTITVTPQALKAVTYTTIIKNQKHALTVNVTAKEITAHYHVGICVFLGTTHKSELTGSVTVSAETTLGIPVNLTETTGA